MAQRRTMAGYGPLGQGQSQPPTGPIAPGMGTPAPSPLMPQQVAPMRRRLGGPQQLSPMTPDNADAFTQTGQGQAPAPGGVATPDMGSMPGLLAMLRQLMGGGPDTGPVMSGR